MSMFSFLSTLELAPVKAAASRTVLADSKNPTSADIRVFRNGSVYPSVRLVKDFDLAYTARAVNGGNALDIIDSREWPQYPALAPKQAVFIAMVPKAAPKTDLFGFTKYNADDSPLSDVLTQGSSSMGKELIDLMAEVYEVAAEDMFHGKNYVDLIITEDQLAASNGIYWFPKAITRGPKKGEIEMIRRENSAPRVLVYKGISVEFPREDGSYGAAASVVPVQTVGARPAFIDEGEDLGFQEEEEEEATPFI